MERKLAHIEIVKNIRPIEGCDNICQCSVLGWNLIIKKDEFQEGDKCVYIEIDSLVPSDNSAFSFLEKRNFKIKTMKMRGTISQGLALPTSILGGKKSYEIGDDVTSALKITKIEDETPELPADRARAKKHWFLRTKLCKKLMRREKFRKIILKLFDKKVKKLPFPNYIVKTDETRIQNAPEWLEEYKGKPMCVTEKLDGTSATYGLDCRKKKAVFSACSRNMSLSMPTAKDYEPTRYTDMAMKYDLEKVLKDIRKDFFPTAETLVLQGEIIGENIQKNKYKLKGNDIYCFNLTVDRVKVDSVRAAEIAAKYGLKWVPIIDAAFLLKDTVDDMVKYAGGRSVLYGDTVREGVVIRDAKNTVSFKVINPDFLLKWDL
ncbi:MAG: hypothetical protein LBT20_02635 [Clostridiales bacterium]|jgi:hypothetical protein|nr:hypothetical protein [Clostridiales bacterium]